MDLKEMKETCSTKHVVLFCYNWQALLWNRIISNHIYIDWLWFGCCLTELNWCCQTCWSLQHFKTNFIVLCICFTRQMCVSRLPTFIITYNKSRRRWCWVRLLKLRAFIGWVGVWHIIELILEQCNILSFHKIVESVKVSFPSCFGSSKVACNLH